MGKSPEEKAFRFLIIIVTLASVVCLLIANIDYIKTYPILVTLLNNAGTSGLVAVLLIYTVEQSTREKNQKATEKLAEELNKDVIKAVYKRHIPESVMTEVEKCLLKSNVSRRHYKVLYSIKRISRRNGFSRLSDEEIDEIAKKYFYCEIKLRYSLTNITNTKQSQNVIFNLESPIEPRYKELAKVLSMKIGEKVLSTEEIEKASDSNVTQVSFCYPFTLDPRETVTITCSGGIIKQHIDSELWNCVQPTDGMELTVSNDIEGLKVFANANHFERLESIFDDENTKIWGLPYGIFPYQSVSLWWEYDKKDSTTTQNTPQLVDFGT